MKIRDLLADSYYQQKKVVEKLLCHYTGVTKEQLFTSYDTVLTKEQVDAIKTWYDAYTKDKRPLEFIMWYVEFFQRKFKVDERCLIPRPETEYMIEAVNELIIAIKQHPHNPYALIDVGTWCGVLWLSVLTENPDFFNIAVLTEYYENTLSLAKENFVTYQPLFKTQTHVIKSNLVAFLQQVSTDNSPALSHIAFEHDIILIANLPYIPDETFDTQAEDNVKKREPRPAFVWWKDGLDFYREMFAQLLALQDTCHAGLDSASIDSASSEGWHSITMFLEMMTRQVDILRQEFGDKIDFEEIKTFHFNIRIVKGTLR